MSALDWPEVAWVSLPRLLKGIGGDAVARKRQSEAKLPFPETEVEAYGFIRRQLGELGWLVKNPNLATGGQVWTQNQCAGHPEIKTALGKRTPENIVKLSETQLWVIEAKSCRAELGRAIDEATDYYAKPINDNSGHLRAVLATGVAGTEEGGYLIRSKILLDGIWHVVTINGQEATGLLSPQDVLALLDSKTADVHEFIPSQWLFLKTAERINGILHLGGINKNDRAKTMAALLLSVAEEAPPNVDTTLPVLIAEINGRSQAILTTHGKPNFAPFVEILKPTNTSNHVKFKNALVRTIQELQNLNIRSAMNSSTDVLGQFYEVFLKYGNGAKEIGIVLTPRHVTRFAVEAVGISPQDIVLDPACGTGGFLVAAFDYVRKIATAPQLLRFKKHNLFGIEQESTVAALAIVNMIFRGDGKNNMTEANAFTTHLVRRTVNGEPSAAYSKNLVRAGEEPVTRVLMNPPFALRGGKEKEYHFVSHALQQMADGGLLFSLLPMGVMFGQKGEKPWRRDELLRLHTLLAAISLPVDLFQPAAAKQVVAVIVRKGFPHPKGQPVFWARVSHDGYLMVKKKRLPAADLRPPRVEEDQLPIVLPMLRSFLASPTTYRVNEPTFCKTAPIDYDDEMFELLPEAYLDSKTPTTAELELAVDEMARDVAAFLVRFGREARAEDFDEAN
jgi:type I restriction enzyme M protein